MKIHLTPPSPSNSEWLTRKRLVDSVVKASGWKVAPFVHGKPLTAQQCFAIEEYPTAARPGMRYGFIDKSILVVTEGFGPQKFHGRVVVLVNKHTSSAGEMVAAFAEENQLATIVGTKTPERLLSGSAFKAGFGYIVGVPVAAYLTWEGRLIEGKGVSPNITVALSRLQRS